MKIINFWQKYKFCTLIGVNDKVIEYIVCFDFSQQPYSKKNKYEA